MPRALDYKIGLCALSFTLGLLVLDRSVLCYAMHCGRWLSIQVTHSLTHLLTHESRRLCDDAIGAQREWKVKKISQKNSNQDHRHRCRSYLLQEVEEDADVLWCIEPESMCSDSAHLSSLSCCSDRRTLPCARHDSQHWVNMFWEFISFSWLCSARQDPLSVVVAGGKSNVIIIGTGQKCTHKVSGPRDSRQASWKNVEKWFTIWPDSRRHSFEK